MLTVRKKSQRQEKRVAKELKAKVTPASGALWGAKGDVRNKDYLVECKTTDSDGYSLNLATWRKIFLEALHDGFREPVMCIDIEGGKYRLAVFDYKMGLEYVAWFQKYYSSLPCITRGSQSKSRKLKRFEGTIIDSFHGKFFDNGNRAIYNTMIIITPWKYFLEYLDDVDEGKV